MQNPENTRGLERGSNEACEPAEGTLPPEVGDGPLSSPEYATEEIFRGSRLVKIRQAGQEYRLLITRNNRLILQK